MLTSSRLDYISNKVATTKHVTRQVADESQHARLRLPHELWLYIIGFLRRHDLEPDDVYRGLLTNAHIVDVNCKVPERYDGFTRPLHAANHGYDTDILAMLLACPGIDVNAEDSRGTTAIVEYSRQDGADTYTKTSKSYGLFFPCSEMLLARADLSETAKSSAHWSMHESFSAVRCDQLTYAMREEEERTGIAQDWF